MRYPEPIPLFGLGIQEKSTPAIAQQRINLYYELKRDQDRARMVAFGTPGLEEFTDFGGNPARGFHAPLTSEYAYFVHDNIFYQVDSSGARTSRGTLNTASGAVSMADNGRYIAVVDGNFGYYYDMDNAATPIARITDANFPNGAQDVTYSDGYFICELDGAFHISDANTPVSWPGDSATAESSPDNLLRIIADHQELALFGGSSTEFWAHTGNADFPFERIPGAANEWGLAARRSLVKYDDSLAFLANNKLGQVIAARLQGYRVVPLSSNEHDLYARWARLGSIAEATAYSYMLDGHPFYVVNIGGETWMYDGSTSGWSRLKSHELERHRSHLHQPFNGGNYVTDYANGKVYKLRHDVYTDNGDPIRRVLVGRHVFDGFRRMGIDAFQLDIETGVGLASGQGSNPQAMLRISKDGGRTFGNERLASFGAVGEYTKRCIWRRCGRARDFVFEVAISDPVKVAISGAAIQPR
jgi:hypothetical protein